MIAFPSILEKYNNINELSTISLMLLIVLGSLVDIQLVINYIMRLNGFAPPQQLRGIRCVETIKLGRVCDTLKNRHKKTILFSVLSAMVILSSCGSFGRVNPPRAEESMFEQLPNGQSKVVSPITFDLIKNSPNYN